MLYKKTRRIRQSLIEKKLNEEFLEGKKIETVKDKFIYTLMNYFGQTSDLKIENVHFGQRKGSIVYLTTMTDSKVITEKISDPLTLMNSKSISSEKDWELFCEKVFSGANYEMIQLEKRLIQKIVDGYVILFLDGITSVLAVNISTTEKRAIEEPTTQTIIRGPKQGFIEEIDTNLKLVRRRIRNEKLRIEDHTVGSDTATKVSIAYMDGVANQSIIEEVRQRIAAMKTNAVHESFTVEEFITDKTFTPFPLIYNTERPDATSAHILAGKIAIFVDGSPFVLTMPATLNDFVSAPEDYYQPFLMGTFLRWIRYFCFFLALLLPAGYVGVITYHHELIPTRLLMSIVSQREGIPFPTVIEALIMEVTFEILREAGVRMPRAVGGTISIVGGLVIGQAAVEAGIVSNIMVIIVALTAISSFVLPVYSFAIGVRLLRFIFIVLAASFGFYGILIGIIVMVGHMASLRSFSAPYLAPFAPLYMGDHKDTIFRFPIWSMKTRPAALRSEEPNKQPLAKPPMPPKEENQ